MIAVYLLIYIPILLFVAAFLYETYLSFLRLKKTKVNTYRYVDATWEVTNTLLVFGVVMLVMLFTKSLEALAAKILVSTLLAGLALAIRSICYTYIFYVRKKPAIGAVDWLFAASHVVAAGLLVVTVIQSTIFLIADHPQANTQFIPYFIPGLVFVLAICSAPLVRLYQTK